MRFHSQNLTDGKFPTWRHGRAWLGPFHAEWSVLYRPGLAVGFRKGGHVDDGTGVQVHLALLLFSIYMTFNTARFCGQPYRELRQRELSATWHDGTIQLNLWTGGGVRVRARPWHRNCVILNVREWFTGRPEYSQTKGDPLDIVIPMPEGCYAATATPVVRVWRNRFGKTVSESWDVSIPSGIPFQGKGENSWDCGDDGLYGTGGSGTLEEVIGEVVASVLTSRKRYGNVSRLRDTSPVMAPAGG